MWIDRVVLIESYLQQQLLDLAAHRVRLVLRLLQLRDVVPQPPPELRPLEGAQSDMIRAI